MLLRLQRYNLHVTYQRGTEMHIADALSRAHLGRQPGVCTLQYQDMEATEELSVSPERLQAIKAATASDTVLESLGDVVKRSWPEERSKLEPELCPYFHMRDEITIQNSLLFKSNRVLVPASLRHDVMQRIRSGHLGIQACLRMIIYTGLG